MIAIAVALALAALGFALKGSVFLLRELVRPDVLLALLAANAAVFVFRAHCTLDAYKTARRARAFASHRAAGTPAGRTAAVAVLLVLVAVPHAVAGYYGYRSYDVLTTVFAEDEPADASPSGSQSSLAGPPPQNGGGSSPAGVPPPPALGPVAPADAGPGTTTETEAAEPKPSALAEEPPSYWKDRGRINILLVGGDAGPYRYGIRTDTMIVISISTRTEKAAVFGVPRNLSSVPLPPSAQTELDTFPDILNALWGYAEAHPEMFPGAKRPGPTALKATIGSLLGLRIDYYAAVDLRGFVEAVDALGGVTVNVQRHVWDAGISPPVEGEPLIAIDLEPGRHHLDGRTALAYVRTRWASSDYDRMHRQRCVIGALAQQASVGRLLRAFPKIASTMKKYVVTDIPLKALPDLIELVAGLDTEKMVGVSFAPPAFGTVADPVEMQAAVRSALQGKLDPELGLETVGVDCA
jgi:LCP family protein required for cell wall assembly